MKEGPDFARVAALMGDPARANMLLGLLQVPALTAGELAREGGVTAATASSHLAQLLAGGLIRVATSGRHRYYRLADDDVAHHLEQLLGLAQHLSHSPVRPGPSDPAMRRARVCYEHLAGEIAVSIFQKLRASGALQLGSRGVTLTPSGLKIFAGVGIVLPTTVGKRPLCRECLDWSERRPHLAGIAGAALLAVCFSSAGSEESTEVARSP